MKRLLVTLPILCLLLASCSSTLNFFGFGGGKDEKPQEPSIVLVDYGIYDGSGGLTLATTSVPRKLGTTFGMRFRTLKPEGGSSKVKVITASPGIIDPAKNAVVFNTESTVDVKTGTEYNCTFTFEKEWEMASGDWTLTAVAEDGTSVKKTFQIYNPQQ